MKKGILSVLSVGFVLFLIVGSKLNLFSSDNEGSFPTPHDEPNFTVSNKFDGHWFGRRINTTGNNMCERTTITGDIIAGKASLRLTYNGTSLQGWVSDDGHLRLYARHRQWDYRFSATAYKNKIQGNWHLTNGPCKGTWYLERTDKEG
ncbi:hypothetical protein [uncultured Vibrio sp.]|uniref:hypothetical protein n=1 Tax=uncultured Vibrio sp. TaxID=114054 RepID=UPI0025D20EEF|nr:hypothetical protein [uncultured Vibrio sp.]